MSNVGAPPPRPSTARLSMPPMAALEELPRPRSITLSFWCWVFGGVLAVAVVGLLATRADVLHAEFARLAREDDGKASRATIDGVANASVLIVIGAGALVAVLGVLLAPGLRAARGWARALLAVVALAALAYVILASSTLNDLLTDLRGPIVVGLAAYALLVIVAAVGMFLPGTSAWFQRPRRR
jgi:hypothetical protein